MGGIRPVFKLREGTNPFNSERPKIDEQLELMPEGGGAPYFGVCTREPYTSDDGEELLIDLVWLMPAKEPQFYRRKTAELPRVWKLAEPSTQPFACVDHWGYIFDVEGGMFTLERGKDITAQAEARNAADAAAKQVHTHFLGRHLSGTTYSSGLIISNCCCQIILVAMHQIRLNINGLGF
jgi:hypothetical protein